MVTSETKDNSVDFSGLILGFCSAALSYMGHSSGEMPGVSLNLVLAKQNIEIIEILKAKTKGNLTADEQRLLDQVLTDLRLKFAEAARKA